MSKKAYLSIIFILIFSFIISCGKKEDKVTENKDSSSVANLIKKDPVSGKDKVVPKYIVKKGDKFSYKLTEKNTVTQKGTITENKEVSQSSENNYYYTKEVTDVDNAAGIISYKVQYDSIIMSAKMDTQEVAYNSNVKDTNNMNAALVKMYNSMVKEPFYIRVSQEGEITDVYGLEKIHENIFKALGDTLNDQEKAQVKDSFGKDAIKEVLQQEYQVFPKQEISVDSSWIRSYNTALSVFEVVNTAKYTLKSIENKNNQYIFNIDAGLNVEFLKKEVQEKGIKFVVENSETSGNGTIVFNFSKGCIQSKQTTTAVTLAVKMSSQGQSANNEQKVTSSTIVTLLN
ncbi:MAG: DUF6263 family protein [Ignavibacteria bacterium]